MTIRSCISTPAANPARCPFPPSCSITTIRRAFDQLLVSIPDFAREHKLGYLLLTPGDFYRDLHENGATQLWDAVEAIRAFVPRFQTPALRVYQFRGPGAAPTSLRSGL